MTARENSVVKERVAKSYRHPVLDEEIRRKRNKREASVLKKLFDAGLPVPRVIKTTDYSLELEKISGNTASTELENANSAVGLAREMGGLIAMIHSLGVIHGDLTPANFIVSKKLYAIDFGLSFHSLKAEDKATDLHVLEESLEAKYPKRWKELWQAVLEGYAEEAKDYAEVSQRLVKVNLRGRYKMKNKK